MVRVDGSYRTHAVLFNAMLATKRSLTRRDSPRKAAAPSSAPAASTAATAATASAVSISEIAAAACELEGGGRCRCMS
jgi:hypothetical protein